MLCVGAEHIADTGVAGRSTREITEDCDPVCQAAERHLRDPVLSVKVRPRHRHPRHIRSTRLRSNCRQGNTVDCCKDGKWSALDRNTLSRSGTACNFVISCCVQSLGNE